MNVLGGDGTWTRLGRAVALTMLCAIAASASAQTCSGGPEGGADATGHQCNAASDEPDAGPFTVSALRGEGYSLYERGHYAQAVHFFRSAAERGDRRSAEMLVLMHRYNAQLYGGRVTISDVEARHWIRVMERAMQANLAPDTRAQR